tara:strand:- start:169 stop:3957 length:3789 start_codon:yes stop_codon:yes gene_type:complete
MEQAATVPTGGNALPYLDRRSIAKFNKLKVRRDKLIKNLESYDNQMIGLGEYRQLLETSKQYTQQINKNGFGAGTAFLVVQESGKTITPTSSQDMPDKIIIPNFPRSGGMVSFFTSTFIQTQSWWKNPENEQRKIDISKSFTDILDRVRQNDPNISTANTVVDNSKRILDSMESKIDYLVEDDIIKQDRVSRKDRAVDDFVKRQEQKYITEHSSMIFGQAQVTPQQTQAWRSEGEQKISTKDIYLAPGDVFMKERQEAQTELSATKASLQVLKQQYKSLDMDLASVAMQNYIAKDSEFDYKDKIKFTQVLDTTYKLYNDFNRIESDIVSAEDRYNNLSTKASEQLKASYTQNIAKLKDEILKNPTQSQSWINNKKDEITRNTQQINQTSDIMRQGRSYHYNKDPYAFLLQHSIENIIPGINYVQNSLTIGTKALNDFFMSYTLTKQALNVLYYPKQVYLFPYRYYGKSKVMDWGQDQYENLKRRTKAGLKRSQMLALVASRANMVKRGRISDLMGTYSDNIKEFLPDSQEKDELVGKLEDFNELLKTSLQASEAHQESFTQFLSDITINNISNLNDPDFEQSIISTGGTVAEVAQRIATDIMTDISTQVDVMTEIDIDLLTDFAYAYDRPDVDLSSLSSLSPSNNVQLNPEPPLIPSDSQEFRKFTTSSLGLNIEENMLENLRLNQTGKKKTKLDALVPQKVQKIWEKRALELGNSRMFTRNMLWMAYDKKASEQLETEKVDLDMLLTMTRTTQFLRNMDVKTATQNKVDTQAADNWFSKNSDNEYVKVQYSEKRKDEIAKSTATWSGTDSNEGANLVDNLETRGVGWRDSIRVSDQGLLRIVNYGKEEDEKINSINEFYRIVDDPQEENPEIFWNNPHVLDLFSSDRPGMNAGDVSNKARWITNNQNLMDDDIIRSNYDKITGLFNDNREEINSTEGDTVAYLLKSMNRDLKDVLTAETIQAESVEKSYIETIFGSGSWIANSYVMNEYNKGKELKKHIEREYLNGVLQAQVSPGEEVKNQPVLINRGPNDEIVVTKLKHTFSNSDIDDFAFAVVKQNLADPKGGSFFGSLHQMGFRGIEALYNTYETKGTVDWSSVSQLTNTRNLCSTLDINCPPAEASVGEIRDLVFEGNTKIAKEEDAIVRESLDNQINMLKQASISDPSSNVRLQSLASELIKSYDIIHETSKAKAIRNSLYTTLGKDRAMDRGYVQSDEHLFINFLSWRTYQKEADITSASLNDHYKMIYEEHKDLIDEMKDAELV